MLFKVGVFQMFVLTFFNKKTLEKKMYAFLILCSQKKQQKYAGNN